MLTSTIISRKRWPRRLGLWWPVSSRQEKSDLHAHIFIPATRWLLETLWGLRCQLSHWSTLWPRANPGSSLSLRSSSVKWGQKEHLPPGMIVKIQRREPSAWNTVNGQYVFIILGFWAAACKDWTLKATSSSYFVHLESILLNTMRTWHQQLPGAGHPVSHPRGPQTKHRGGLRQGLSLRFGRDKRSQKGWPG